MASFTTAVLTLTCIQHFMCTKSVFIFTLCCGTSMAWKNPAGSWPIERDIVVQRSPLAPLFSMCGPTLKGAPLDLSLILCPEGGGMPLGGSPVGALGRRRRMRFPDCCAGILKQFMGARNRVGIGLSYRPARLHSLAELVPWNRIHGLHKSLKIWALMCDVWTGCGGTRAPLSHPSTPMQQGDQSSLCPLLK
jgi:hypothetical protein